TPRQPGGLNNSIAPGQIGTLLQPLAVGTTGRSPRHRPVATQPRRRHQSGDCANRLWVRLSRQPYGTRLEERRDAHWVASQACNNTQLSRRKPARSNPADRGGSNMAEQWNHAPLLKLVSELAATWQTATKKVAGWYIDVGERLVKETVELQKRVTDWATDTSWIPLVEEQNTITDEFIERSTNVARRLWQMQIEKGKEAAQIAEEEMTRFARGQA